MAMTPAQRHTALVSMADHYRGALGEIIAGALIRVQRAPLAVNGLGTIAPAELSGAHVSDRAARHGYALPALPALAAARSPRLPLALPRAPDGQSVIWIRTRGDWRRVLDAWHGRVSVVASRSAIMMRILHDELDVVAAVTPILGSDGQTITGPDALAAREAKFAALSSGYFSGQASEIDKFLGRGAHPPPGSLSAVLPEAREQLLDRLDDAAAEVRGWLLDDPHGRGAGPANTVQQTAILLLDRRRQDARRAVRGAVSVTAAGSTAVRHLALIRGVGVEDGPQWWRRHGVGTDVTITGAAPYAGASVSLAYAEPATGRWSQAFRAANPARPGGDKSAAALGAVVLDTPDTPAGWTVTDSPRAAPVPGRDVTIAWAGTGEPPAGTHFISLTARNGCGPAKIVAAITVPAPAAPAE